MLLMLCLRVTTAVWMDNPYPDWDLGKKIVLEMKSCGIDVLVWLT